MYSPMFPPEMPASLESGILSAPPRHFRTHRASFDLELLRLIQHACCSCCSVEWSERSTVALFVVGVGWFVCLFVLRSLFIVIFR